MASKSPQELQMQTGGTGVTGMESWDSAGPKFLPLQWEPALPSKGSWWAEARTGGDVVLQVKTRLEREKKNNQPR